MREIIIDLKCQQRSLKRAHDISNEIKLLSKEIIDLVVNGEYNEALSLFGRIKNLISEYLDLYLPDSFKAYKEFEYEQEVVEALIVFLLFGNIISNEKEFDLDDIFSLLESSSLPITMDGFYPQSVVYGITDGLTELSRCVSRYIVMAGCNKNERGRIRKRLLNIVKNVYCYLDENLSGIPVVDAYNRYKFKNSFRSRMNRIRNTINYITGLLERELD
jgi:predicted translin family RNA/ssDNA-binding protein